MWSATLPGKWPAREPQTVLTEIGGDLKSSSSQQERETEVEAKKVLEAKHTFPTCSLLTHSSPSQEGAERLKGTKLSQGPQIGEEGGSILLTGICISFAGVGWGV